MKQTIPPRLNSLSPSNLESFAARSRPSRAWTGHPEIGPVYTNCCASSSSAAPEPRCPSLHTQVAVYVDDDGIALDLDGVDLEPVEGDAIARGGGRVLQCLAQQLGRVHPHAGRNLAAQER